MSVDKINSALGKTSSQLKNALGVIQLSEAATQNKYFDVDTRAGE